MTKKEIIAPTMVTIAKASEITSLSYDFLMKLCKENKIVYIKSGNRYLINLDKLLKFMNGELG